MIVTALHSPGQPAGTPSGLRRPTKAFVIQEGALQHAQVMLTCVPLHKLLYRTPQMCCFTAVFDDCEVNNTQAQKQRLLHQQAQAVYLNFALSNRYETL